MRPDGICLDAEGSIWVAAPAPGWVLCVEECGQVIHQVKVSTKPYACMLGGPHHRMLFVCTAGSSLPDEARTQAGGRIEIVEVNVSGAGLP